MSAFRISENIKLCIRFKNSSSHYYDEKPKNVLDGWGCAARIGARISAVGKYM